MISKDYNLLFVVKREGNRHEFLGKEKKLEFSYIDQQPHILLGLVRIPGKEREIITRRITQKIR